MMFAYAKRRNKEEVEKIVDLMKLNDIPFDRYSYVTLSGFYSLMKDCNKL
jgi:pentatricopeptide repeat protein